MNRRAFGSAVETSARQYLTTAGLELISTNFTCRMGEIDLIMLDSSILVFIEVRFRADAKFGGAKRSVTQVKQQRLIKTAKLFLLRNQQFREYCCRFDVIAARGELGNIRFDWIKDAFRLC